MLMSRFFLWTASFLILLLWLPSTSAFWHWRTETAYTELQALSSVPGEDISTPVVPVFTPQEIVAEGTAGCSKTDCMPATELPELPRIPITAPQTGNLKEILENMAVVFFPFSSWKLILVTGSTLFFLFKLVARKSKIPPPSKRTVKPIPVSIEATKYYTSQRAELFEDERIPLFTILIFALSFIISLIELMRNSLLGAFLMFIIIPYAMYIEAFYPSFLPPPRPPPLSTLVFLPCTRAWGQDRTKASAVLSGEYKQADMLVVKEITASPSLSATPLEIKRSTRPDEGFSKSPNAKNSQNRVPSKLASAENPRERSLNDHVAEADKTDELSSATTQQEVSAIDELPKKKEESVLISATLTPLPEEVTALPNQASESLHVADKQACTLPESSSQEMNKDHAAQSTLASEVEEKVVDEGLTKDDAISSELPNGVDATRLIEKAESSELPQNVDSLTGSSGAPLTVEKRKAPDTLVTHPRKEREKCTDLRKGDKYDRNTYEARIARAVLDQSEQKGHSQTRVAHASDAQSQPAPEGPSTPRIETTEVVSPRDGANGTCGPFGFPATTTRGAECAKTISESKKIMGDTEDKFVQMNIRGLREMSIQTPTNEYDERTTQTYIFECEDKFIQTLLAKPKEKSTQTDISKTKEKSVQTLVVKSKGKSTQTYEPRAKGKSIQTDSPDVEEKIIQINLCKTEDKLMQTDYRELRDESIETRLDERQNPLSTTRAKALCCKCGNEIEQASAGLKRRRLTPTEIDHGDSAHRITFGSLQFEWSTAASSGLRIKRQSRKLAACKKRSQVDNRNSSSHTTKSLDSTIETKSNTSEITVNTEIEEPTVMSSAKLDGPNSDEEPLWASHRGDEYVGDLRDGSFFPSDSATTFRPALTQAELQTTCPNTASTYSLASEQATSSETISNTNLASRVDNSIWTPGSLRRTDMIDTINLQPRSKVQAAIRSAETSYGSGLLARVSAPEQHMPALSIIQHSSKFGYAAQRLAYSTGISRNDVVYETGHLGGPGSSSAFHEGGAFHR